MLEVGADPFNPCWSTVNFDERVQVNKGHLLILKLGDDNKFPHI